MTAVIRVENITKSFSDHTVLDHISIEFESGYIHLLNGKNGCGKSTFLKILYGLLIPDEGKVFWGDRDIEKKRTEYLEHIGIVTADERSLYHKLSARENLYYIGRLHNIPKKELNERITELLDRLNLADDSTLVENFSTGMKKKVMVARAFLNDPDIIFADEVMNGLDTDTCNTVEEMFQEAVEKGKTSFLVSRTGVQDLTHVRSYLVEGGHICYVESSEKIPDDRSEI